MKKKYILIYEHEIEMEVESEDEDIDAVQDRVQQKMLKGEMDMEYRYFYIEEYYPPSNVYEVSEVTDEQTKT